MALPSSGAISLNDVNVELGNSGTAQISMNDAAVRGLFGVASGQISMSDGYGKSNQFEFSITSNTNDANLRTLAVSAGWNQSSKVVATINSGVYISSSSTGSAALTIDGSWPGGVELNNNGIIAGRGGNGGVSGGWNGGYPTNGSPGSSGGGALSVSSSVTIYNNNIIAGGGGGGGGGGHAGFSGYECGGTSSGGGGGGGRSNVNYYSSGGGVGTVYLGGAAGNSGGTGTHNAAGSGGNGGVVNSCNSSSAGNGGSGGGWGSGGGSGNSGSSGNGSVGSGGGGGSAGYAVSGNSNITWGATGTRYGSIG